MNRPTNLWTILSVILALAVIIIVVLYLTSLCVRKPPTVIIHPIDTAEPLDLTSHEQYPDTNLDDDVEIFDLNKPVTPLPFTESTASDNKDEYDSVSYLDPRELFGTPLPLPPDAPSETDDTTSDTTVVPTESADVISTTTDDDEKESQPATTKTPTTRKSKKYSLKQLGRRLRQGVTVTNNIDPPATSDEKAITNHNILTNDIYRENV